MNSTHNLFLKYLKYGLFFKYYQTFFEQVPDYRNSTVSY